MRQVAFSVGIFMVATMVNGCTTCTTTDNDPKSGGFVGGVCGLTSGAYDRRLDEKEVNLQSSQAQQQTVEKEKRRLHSDKAEKLRQKQALSADLNNVSNENRKLSAKLAQIKSKDAATRKKKAGLQKRIQNHNAQITQLKKQSSSSSKSAQSDAAIAAQKKKAEELNQEVKQLWQILNTMD